MSQNPNVALLKPYKYKQEEESQKSKANILLICDCNDMKVHLSQFIGAENDVVLQTVTHEEAHAAIAKRSDVDIIIGYLDASKQHSILTLQETIQQTPIIVISSAPSKHELEQVMRFENSHYITYPFQQFNLQFALAKAQKEKQSELKPKGLYVFNKYRHRILLPFSTICYLETEGNYTYIFTNDNKKHSIKKSLTLIEKELSSDFIRIQRRYIINEKYTNKIDFSKNIININDMATLPIGLKYRNEVKGINAIFA